VAGTSALVVLLVVWQIAGEAKVVSGAVPPPTSIVSAIRHVGWNYWATNAGTTLREAGQGWLWGNGVAVVLAVSCILVPLAERALMRVAIAAYCIPVIAIGPILEILFQGDTPRVILAALTCFFTTLIGALVGLRAADQSSMDLVRAYGGGRLSQLVKVRLRSGLPSFFVGLRIAAPTAVLGAIIGEYLGGGSGSGLGVAMTASQAGLEIARTWAIALVATLLAGVAYGLTALVGRLATPWIPRAGRS
jgi:ABC-type nitrate/sulfonate/bicarbonate transport system permease component